MDVNELVTALTEAAPRLRKAGVTHLAVDPSGRWEVEIAPEQPSPLSEIDLSTLANPPESRLSKEVDDKLCLACQRRPKRYGELCRVCTRTEVVSGAS